ncbi:MAG: hypothetical protein KBD51_00450 [Candidatus Levybacteria bacterium]|nr:hypothetical protein [Candidatus Levybacteria bacterium]
MSTTPGVGDGLPIPLTEAVRPVSKPAGPAPITPEAATNNQALASIISRDLGANPTRLDAALADAARVDQSVVPPAVDGITPLSEALPIAEPLPAVEPQRPETMSDDPRYKGLVQDLSLNYLRSSDSEWFNDRFPDPSVDENGYLTDKDGHKWLPSQNIGGRFAEMEAKARDRFAELYPDDARAYSSKAGEPITERADSDPATVATETSLDHADSADLPVVPVVESPAEDLDASGTDLDDTTGGLTDEQIAQALADITKDSQPATGLSFGFSEKARQALAEAEAKGELSVADRKALTTEIERAEYQESLLRINIPVLAAKESLGAKKGTKEEITTAKIALKEATAKRKEAYREMFEGVKKSAKAAHREYSEVLGEIKSDAKIQMESFEASYKDAQEKGTPEEIADAKTRFEAAREHYSVIKKEKRKDLIKGLLKAFGLSAVTTIISDSTKQVKSGAVGPQRH